MSESVIPACAGSERTLRSRYWSDPYSTCDAASFAIAAVDALLNKTSKILRICYGTQNDRWWSQASGLDRPRRTIDWKLAPPNDSSDDDRTGTFYLATRRDAGIYQMAMDLFFPRSQCTGCRKRDDLNCVFLHLVENPTLSNGNPMTRQWTASMVAWTFEDPRISISRNRVASLQQVSITRTTASSIEVERAYWTMPLDIIHTFISWYAKMCDES
jgi:hypothetical protein